MRHRTGLVATFVVFGILLGRAAVTGGEPLRMQVTPAVQRAPAFLTVRVSIERSADNRMLEVVAESPAFYRSSQIQIDGANAPPLNVFEFPNLPSGLYQVTGVLVGAHGQRAMVSKIASVQPPFGR